MDKQALVSMLKQLFREMRGMENQDAKVDPAEALASAADASEASEEKSEEMPEMPMKDDEEGCEHGGKKPVMTIIESIGFKPRKKG